MNFITLPERIILESIHEKKKTVKEIQTETQLSFNITYDIIKEFCSKGVLLYKDQHYSINPNLSEALLAELHNTENTKIEINEIVNASISKKIDLKCDDSLKLKKVYMNIKEEKIYKGLLKNLESFITSLEKKSGSINQKKIIFWGENTYENVLNFSFNS